MLATDHETQIDFADAERLHPRVDANFMVMALSHGRSVLYKARDLSMDGIFLIDHGGKAGHEVHLVVPLPNDCELQVVGRIVRREEDGVAVKFDALDWEEIFAFARYLHPRLP